jgi:cellulose synthase (UDP-forming)
MRGLVIVSTLVLISLLAVPYWLLLRPEDTEAVLVNTLWSGFNLLLLVAALLVGFEQPQIRTAHRLQRRLPVVISCNGQAIMGETINISETGALINLESWPNLPDEVQIEVMGDFNARATVTARVIRLSPIDNDQTHLGVDFINLSRQQLDALGLVLYSDVREWYSQKREDVDQPFASLSFLATSLPRSLRDIKPTTTPFKVRKQVRAVGQLYWDGHFFPGVATELGVTGVRLELEGNKALSAEKFIGQEDLHRMRTVKPLVGLLLSHQDNSHDLSISTEISDRDELDQLQQMDDSRPNMDNIVPSRFIAEITAIEEDNGGRISLELKFPEKFQQRQSTKVKELLQSL